MIKVCGKDWISLFADTDHKEKWIGKHRIKWKMVKKGINEMVNGKKRNKRKNRKIKKNENKNGKEEKNKEKWE